MAPWEVDLGEFSAIAAGSSVLHRARQGVAQLCFARPQKALLRRKRCGPSHQQPHLPEHRAVLLSLSINSFSPHPPPLFFSLK